MSLKFAKIATSVAILAAAGVGLWARSQLPDAPIGTHFDLQGHVNGTLPRDIALAFGPGIALALAATMLWLLPAIMPKNAAVERSSEAYGASVTVIIFFLCLIHAGVVAVALHYPVDLPRWVLAGTGLLFVVLGNYLPKTRYNYVMGIRNPWTLCNEEVWDKTHRLSGPLFMLAGALIVAGAFVVPLPLGFMLMVPAVVVVVLICNAYSYLVAKRLKLA